MTVEEVADFFKRCGRLAKHPGEQAYKIKLYTSPSGELKGDCRVGYEKIESVKLAIDILDKQELREGFSISV